MIKIEPLDGQLIITISLSRESGRCESCGTVIEGRQYLMWPEGDIRLLGLHLAYWADILAANMIEQFSMGVHQTRGDQ